MSPLRSFWLPLLLRATSVVLLIVSLGNLIYCKAKFGVDLPAGYGMVCKTQDSLPFS
jgi:hypothetical protein